MQSTNSIKDMKPYHVEEISINSRETHELLDHITRTNVDPSFSISKSFQLLKAFSIQNIIFDREFNEKREEIQNSSFYQEPWDVKFGFLSTNKEDLINKLAEEGLEISMCPYNYLGHCVSGLHICANADVCLKEAHTQVKMGNDIILLIFKYMVGKRKMVPMHDPKILRAPTPNFSSHVCEEKPVPTEQVVIQYIKSLVYLYEFANDLYEPAVRPRHCCPIGALVYNPISLCEVFDLTDSDTADISPLHHISPFSLRSINPKRSETLFWNTQYPDSNYDKDMENNKQNQSDYNEWKPINHPVSSGEAMLLKPFEMDISNRMRPWNEGITVYGGIKYNKSLSSRIGKPY